MVLVSYEMDTCKHRPETCLNSNSRRCKVMGLFANNLVSILKPYTMAIMGLLEKTLFHLRLISPPDLTFLDLFSIIMKPFNIFQPSQVTSPILQQCTIKQLLATLGHSIMCFFGSLSIPGNFVQPSPTHYLKSHRLLF